MRNSTFALLVALLLAAPGAAQQEVLFEQSVDAASVAAMIQTGDLLVVSRRVDRLLPDRVHEHLAQYRDGVPVHGAGVSRQIRNGETISLLGQIHEDIDISTVPTLSADDAARLAAEATGASAADTAELVVLPLLDPSYRLVYRILMSDARLYFVDADDGVIVWSYTVTKEQQARRRRHGYRRRSEKHQHDTRQRHV